MRLPSLSVVFPFLNDAGSLEWLLERARRAAADVSERHEIVVIDDGSRVDEAAALDRVPGVRVVRHARNLGYGAAVARGIRETRLEWVFYTDADGQYDPDELRGLVELLTRDPAATFVNGYKRRRDDPAHRVLLGAAYRELARALWRLPIRDVNCDFRLINGRLARGLRLSAAGGAFGLELVCAARRAGARFAEVPVHHYARRHGRSEFFRAPRLWRFAAELARLAGGA